MKLAQALQHRSDLQNKAENLRERLVANATFQEGEKPVESPSQLMKELDSVILELQEYIYRIHKTNSETITEYGIITELLAKRDALSLKRSIYEEFARNASEVVQRYGRNEIKIYPSVDVPELRKQVDDISKELRELDMRIQEANWTTELL